MNLPLVSIIIPVYNTGASAKLLVEKLSNSSYSNLEILLIDDGSTDNSAEILEKIKNPKIKLVRQKNRGVSSTRNLGIKNAKGKYLLFVDSDDDILPNFVSSFVSAIDSSDGVSLAVSAVRYKKLATHTTEDVYLDVPHRNQSETLEDYVVRLLFHDGRMYPVFNKIFRADIVKKNHLRFDESLKFAEDTKFVLDYLKASKGEIKFVPEPLYVYHFGTETSSVVALNRDWKNWARSFKNLKTFASQNPSPRTRMNLALLYLRWRLSWLRAKIKALK